LFGFGSPGGLFNVTSDSANFRKDWTRIRYTTGSWARNRAEFNTNKILIDDRLAVSLAGVYEDSGGWRDYASLNKERIFGSVVFRPIDSLTVTVMGETGKDENTIIRTLTDSDEVLAWYDNREAFGVDAVTFAPNGNNPNSALNALGVTGRNANNTGKNHRIIYVENDNTVFDAVGTYLTGSYNKPTVLSPDGVPGVSSRNLRLYDPKFYPETLNAAGPGMIRDQAIDNYTVSADWQPTENWYFSLAHNSQKTEVVSDLMMGRNPILRGDANTTQGVGGPANPYAGQFYFDGEWRRDSHLGEYEETRVSASYELKTDSKWLGRHRIAGLASRSEQFDNRAIQILALAGRPFDNTPDHDNNKVWIRNYLTEGDYSTYRVGDWRSAPSTINVGGTDYDTTYVNISDHGNNSGGMQNTDSFTGVLQSYLFNERLVATVGYRQDQADVTQFGYITDPILGDVVDTNPANGTLTELTGSTTTLGGTYHLTDWLSIVGNSSSNVGIPSLTRNVLPDGLLPGLSRGEGKDFGVDMSLFNNRITGRLTYYTVYERNRVLREAYQQLNPRNLRVMDALASELVGAGKPISESEWAPVYTDYTPNVGAGGADFDSSGYEARITGNITNNWRMVVNYAHSDSVSTNVGHEQIAWYGLKREEGDAVVRQGVTQDTSTGVFSLTDPSVYESGGVIAGWLELASRSAATHPSVLETDSNGVTLAEELFNMVADLNDTIESIEKRWGLRKHKVSIFTAYDFKEGMMKGFTVGGGWRWRSPNVIGEDANDQEIHGEAITSMDLMLKYRVNWDVLPGTLDIQLNIKNLLNNTDPIPVRLSYGDSVDARGFELPNRGLAYSRIDLVEPREIRVSATYSF